MNDLGLAIEEYRHAQDIDEKISGLEERGAETRDVDEEYRNICMAFEYMDEETEILNMLETIYLESGVKLIGQKHECKEIRLEKSNEYIECTDIKITVSGSRESTVELLRMIEQARGLISIGNVDILVEQGEQLLSSIEIQIYSDSD
ncbi:hypothetical protein [Peptoclostridium litorale]|uniref:hypothetical protein n=1 Tax=Peptoclostridium litorale TaxID=1557 RepID=UPI001A9A2F89|nr:hypothetical protein [Peptoclostridium litorale]